MKGAQLAYTTNLETILFYHILFIKTQAAMFFSADKELVSGRMENGILPMINESGFSDVIRSSDIGNARKTGKTKDHLQWDGGGFLIYQGAKNAKKMRQWSAPLLLKDELDGWDRNVGQDGNSDALTDARAYAYWDTRKILRGSTPLLEPSMINEAYLCGDQRKYMIRCRACSFPQELKHRKPNNETGIVGGFQWDTEGGRLVLESVRYACVECGHTHYEHDKDFIFAEENGAAWVPTATPKEPQIRSYHLPAFYSPAGFRPWSKCISDFLASYDPVAKQTISISRYQEYVNNTLGLPFKQQGASVGFRSVSGHRRTEYRFGQVPNEYAAEHSGSKILFATCTVDVHKRNLAVAVFGWCRDARPYLLDYWRLEQLDSKKEDYDCREISCPAWARLSAVIEEKEYEADDGQKYGVALTFVDAGYANDTVLTFCAQYDSGVHPIIGRARAAKNQRIKEFDPFRTQSGVLGYKLLVDHYKDRMSSVLRRQWDPEIQGQPIYHFNAPMDATDKQLTELTKEYRKEDTDPQGNTFYVWHRPGNAPQELWDLLGYGYASVDVLAYSICIGFFKLETINWDDFWKFAMDSANDGVFCRLE